MTRSQKLVDKRNRGTLVTGRGHTLIAVLLALGGGFALAQRPEKPWQPAPDAPGVIAQTPSASPPRQVALENIATPLPPLQVIATTKPTQPPTPATIVRVSAPASSAPLPGNGGEGGAKGMPNVMPAVDNRPVPVPPPDHPTLPRERLTATSGPLPGAQPGGQTSTISVEKIGPAMVGVGKPFTYEIAVRNPGKAPALLVRVEDQVAANLRYLKSEPPAEVQGTQLLWNLGTLEPGGERRLKVEAQAIAEGEALSSATAICAASSSCRTKVSRPQLAIVKKGPETAHVGESIKFELVVSNSGSGPAEGVVLRDKMPAGFQHPAGNFIEADLGTLKPGESRTIPIEVRVVQAGRLVNEASVTAPGIPEATAQAAVMVTDASLSLRKTGPQQGNPNQELDFGLVVSNTGEAPATGVKLTDRLPEGLAFVSASDGGTFNAKTHAVEWALGTLAAGQSKALSVRLKAIKAGDWVNQAAARTERGQEAKAELPVHVEGVPALLLEVVDLDDPVEIGSETTYEIRVVNQGTAPCTGLRIAGVVPAGLTLLGAEGTVTHRINGNQVIFEPLPKLAAKADVQFKVLVRAVKPGDWRFRVWMSCDHMPKPIFEDESTQVYSDNEDGAGTSTQQEINKRQ
jgi:uncharacterized repeat protein (TIGR01451 family)